MLKLIVKQLIKKRYGEPCQSYSTGCPQCHAWLCYTYLFEKEPDNLIFNHEFERWELTDKE